MAHPERLALDLEIPAILVRTLVKLAIGRDVSFARQAVVCGNSLANLLELSDQ